MRVIRATAFGGPEVLEMGEAPDPEPRDRQVVIDVEVAEVLFLDTQLRAGWGREYFDIEPPFVPGVGVGGTVSSVGADVPPDVIGRRVVAGLSGAGAYTGGGYAERAVADVEGLFDVPDGVLLQHAIAALHDGLMAVSRRERAALRPGDVALVTAATGGVGTWLVPLLAADGVTVVAAASGERKVATARDQGASAAVDYAEDGWPDRIRDAVGGRDVDVVLDGAGGPVGAAAFGLTGAGARFFSYGAASGDFAGIEEEAARRGVEVFGIGDPMAPADARRWTTAALDLLAAGTVVPVIGQALPLEQATNAHAAIGERRVLGKTLLLPGQVTPR